MSVKILFLIPILFLMFFIPVNVVYGADIELVPVDAETDGKNGFEKLLGANDIAIFTVDGTLYAIVVGHKDDSVQIINLSDPTDITPVDTATDEVYGFDELYGANGVETFTVDGTIYAIVVSYKDHGVQIIDLSNPKKITAVSSATDGENGFDELHGAGKVEIFTVDGTLYAIVTSFYDNGVQIIDLSNPKKITAVSSATEGENGFTELEGASDVEIFTVDGTLYAIVASLNDHGVQIIDLSDPKNITPVDSATDGENGFDKLHKAYDAAIFTVDGTIYAIVANVNGVQIIDLSDPTDITPVSSATDGEKGFDELKGASDIEIFTVGGTIYAIVASFYDHGVQIINLSDPTDITPVSSATDGENGFTELHGASEAEIFIVGGTIYAIVSGYFDNGVQIISLSSHYTTDSNGKDENGKDENKKNKGGGCDDCTPPTLGLDKNFKRIVDNGFSFNDNPTQVEFWHTDYPLINATVGEINKMEIKFNENNGLANMKSLQAGLGLPEKGDSLEEAEVLIEIPLITDGTLRGISIDKDNIKIIDPDNLIHPVVVTTVKAVSCQESNSDLICGKLDLYYVYQEAPLNHMVVIEVTDKKNNAQRFHFNDGINVTGDSLNPPNTLYTHGKLFTQVDRVNEIWSDEEGIEYEKNSYNSMKRITPQEPYSCNDPPLEQIKVWNRMNCNFSDY